MSLRLSRFVLFLAVAVPVACSSAAGPARPPAGRGVYVNSDAWNFWLNDKMGGYSAEELKRAIEADVDFYAVPGVRAVFYNMNFQRCFFPTKAGTPYWKDVSFAPDGKMLLRGKPLSFRADESPEAETAYRVMYHAVTNMVRQLPSFVAYRYGCCHRKGVEMWHSFRVNDIHHATLGQEWRPQHCDLWLDDKSAIRAWYRHAWRGEWTDGTLDYANRRVCEQQLGIVREYLMDYPSDGLEFDWLRAVPVFRPGFDDANRGILTQFLRETRRIADEAEKKWGRPIRLAHRVPARVRDAHGVGLDIAAWAREGLVDVLIAGGCPGTATEQDCDVALYRALVPPPVILASEIDCTVFAAPGWRLTIDDSRYEQAIDVGFASSFYQQGADAIYFYNHFPRHAAKHGWIRDLFTKAADRAAVAALPRRHPATFHTHCGESRNDETPFPVAIWPQGCNGGVNVCCGEGTAGRRARVIVGATVPLDVNVLVNAVPCGRAKALEDTERYPSRADCTSHYYTAEIPSGALHDGINNVELFNCGTETVMCAQLVWLEVALDRPCPAFP